MPFSSGHRFAKATHLYLGVFRHARCLEGQKGRAHIFRKSRTTRRHELVGPGPFHGSCDEVPGLRSCGNFTMEEILRHVSGHQDTRPIRDCTSLEMEQGPVLQLWRISPLAIRWLLRRPLTCLVAGQSARTGSCAQYCALVRTNSVNRSPSANGLNTSKY